MENLYEEKGILKDVAARTASKAKDVYDKTNEALRPEKDEITHSILGDSVSLALLHDKGFWKEAKVFYKEKGEEMKKTSKELWEYCHDKIGTDAYMEKLKKIANAYDRNEIPHSYVIEMPDIKLCTARYKRVVDDIFSDIREFINTDYTNKFKLKDKVDKINDKIGESDDLLRDLLTTNPKTFTIPTALDLVHVTLREKNDCIKYLEDLKDQVESFTKRVDRIEHAMTSVTGICARDMLLQSQKLVNRACSLAITFGKQITETSATIFNRVNPLSKIEEKEEKDKKEKDVKENAFYKDFFMDLNSAYDGMTKYPNLMLERAIIDALEEFDSNHIMTESHKDSLMTKAKRALANMINAIEEFIRNLKTKITKIARDATTKQKIKKLKEEIEEAKGKGLRSVECPNIEKMAEVYKKATKEMKSHVVKICGGGLHFEYEFKDEIKVFDDCLEKWDKALEAVKNVKVKKPLDEALKFAEDELEGRTTYYKDISDSIELMDELQTKMSMIEKRVTIQGRDVIKDAKKDRLRQEVYPTLNRPAGIHVISTISHIMQGIGKFIRKWSVILVMGFVFLVV